MELLPKYCSSLFPFIHIYKLNNHTQARTHAPIQQNRMSLEGFVINSTQYYFKNIRTQTNKLNVKLNWIDAAPVIHMLCVRSIINIEPL